MGQKACPVHGFIHKREVTAEEELPSERTLALAYARPNDRDTIDAFLRLDFNLGRAVAQASEPIVGQLRLAWWRESLGVADGEKPPGNPLLEAIVKSFGDRANSLVRLVDGWEMILLAERLDEPAIEALVDGRVQGWLTIASRISSEVDTQRISTAARRWALADLQAGLSEQCERDSVISLAEREPGKVSLPRSMRPLAVLAALSDRAIARGGGELLGDRMAALVALRSGLIGR